MQLVNLNKVQYHHLFALLVFLGGVFFFHGSQGNSIARCDMIFGCVEPGTPDQGTFQIDHFLPAPQLGLNSCDWAHNPAVEPHYYCNKPPGPQLAGIPIYFLLYHLEKTCGAIPESHQWTRFNQWLLNLLLTVFPLAISAPCFLLLLIGLGASRRTALLLGLGLYLGTLVYPYANAFWGHSTAIACLVPGLYFLLRPISPGYGKAGLLLGLAVLTEYSAALPVLLAALMLATQRRWGGVLRFGLGGLGPLLVHAWYHKICFGSCFTAATFYNNTLFLEAEKVGGIFGAMQGEILLELTFAPFRGLFWYMPLLLLALPGALLAWRNGRRSLTLLALGTFSATLLMNLTFNGWHGGACLGPRYLIITLPLLMLLMIDLPPALSNLAKRGLRWTAIGLTTVCLLLALVSWLNMTAIAAISTTGSPTPDGAWSNPLYLYYEKLIRAKGSLHPQPNFPLRLDGDWVVLPTTETPGPQEIARRAMAQTSTNRTSQANGRLAPPGNQSSWAAFTLLNFRPGNQLSMAVDLDLTWQGNLTLWVNGTEAINRYHPDQKGQVVTVNMKPGNNTITLLKRAVEPRPLTIFARRRADNSPLRPSCQQKFGGTNLGEKAGLKGPWCLLPLLLLQLAIGAWLWRKSRPPT